MRVQDLEKRKIKYSCETYLGTTVIFGLALTFCAQCIFGVPYPMTNCHRVKEKLTAGKNDIGFFLCSLIFFSNPLQVVQYWRKQYDWRKREAFLNSLPQFKTYISGLDLHYIHVKPKNVPAGTKVLPLLLIHGWPGSVREFYEAIPLLTTPRKDRNFVFEVSILSLGPNCTVYAQLMHGRISFD